LRPQGKKLDGFGKKQVLCEIKVQNIDSDSTPSRKLNQRDNGGSQSPHMNVEEMKNDRDKRVVESGRVFVIKFPIKGFLMDLNQRLVQQPHLLLQKV